MSRELSNPPPATNSSDGRRLQSSNMGRRAQEFAENAKRKAVSVPATKRRKREDASDEGSDDEEAMVPEALTRKIISQARQQQEEMESEEAPKQPRRGVSFAPVLAAAAGDEDDDGEDGGEDDPEDEVTAEYYEPEDVELDEGDERALDLFMGSRAPQTLADIIMQKIQQHTESAEARAPGEDGAAHLREGEQLMPELPPKVIEVYQGVGRLLSTYRSGKLPKAFKIIPQLTNWEEILYVTQPEEWRPAAMREATRLFASNMNPRMAQRFFNLVLLPAVQVRISLHISLHISRASPAQLAARSSQPLATYHPLLTYYTYYLVQDDIRSNEKL